MITLRRVVITVLVALSLFGFAFAFTIGEGGDDGITTNEAVEGVSPGDGDTLVQQQQPIEIDLAPGWRGVLLFDGTELPQDQLNCIENCFEQPPCPPRAQQVGGAPAGCRPGPFDDPQGRVFFVPGRDKVLEELPSGRHCAGALVWRIGEDRDEGRRVPQWCFRVL